MRPSALRLLVLLLTWTCGAPLPAQTDANPSAPDFSRQVERQTFKLINAYRDQEGLTPLRWNDDIAAIARGHSRDMASGNVDFGHDGFGDRVDQMRQVIAGFEGAGENVLYTSELEAVARRAVQMWLHSPHHLRNIRGDYNFSGIGVWPGKDGTIYFTQLFLKAAEPGQ